MLNKRITWACRWFDQILQFAGHYHHKPIGMLRQKVQTRLDASFRCWNSASANRLFEYRFLGLNGRGAELRQILGGSLKNHDLAGFHSTTSDYLVWMAPKEQTVSIYSAGLRSFSTVGWIQVFLCLQRSRLLAGFQFFISP
jgi:hypothetical protein